MFETIKNDEIGIGSIDFNKTIYVSKHIFRSNLDQAKREHYGSASWYDWSIANALTKPASKTVPQSYKTYDGLGGAKLQIQRQRRLLRCQVRGNLRRDQNPQNQMDEHKQQIHTSQNTHARISELLDIMEQLDLSVKEYRDDAVKTIIVKMVILSADCIRVTFDGGVDMDAEPPGE